MTEDSPLPESLAVARAMLRPTSRFRLFGVNQKMLDEAAEEVEQELRDLERGRARLPLREPASEPARSVWDADMAPPRAAASVDNSAESRSVLDDVVEAEQLLDAVARPAPAGSAPTDSVTTALRMTDLARRLEDEGRERLALKLHRAAAALYQKEIFSARGRPDTGA